MQAANIHQPPKYRADIDGLRAIAVLLVVLEHLQFRHFSGGYVGVDVFFVISGYLIGSSMIAEFQTGTFSLVAFYERRVRRIFPALLVVLAFASLMAWHVLMPKSLLAYAGSLLAALLSCSNFYFYLQSGYFEANSSTKLLLHTWSLGVEEQFYILFPIVLYGLFRWWPQRLRTILWLLVAISLIAACWTMRFNASTAFFWSPLRAWELLVGVLVSQHGFAALRLRWVRELAMFAGLALILYTGVVYSTETHFPGWTAVAPCLGAVLIIATGRVGPSAVGGLLSLPPLRFVGLISYSLYLWHWPLIVLQNTARVFTTQPVWVRSTKLTLLTVSLLLATLSWGLVETPFRKARWRPGRRQLFVSTALAAGMIAAFGLWASHNNGLSSRFPAEVQRIAAFDSYNAVGLLRQGDCFILPVNSFHDFKPSQCMTQLSGHKTYLLFGDSTAAHLYPGLVHIFSEIHFQQATSASCPPYKDSVGRESVYWSNCAALWQYVHGTYLQQQRPDVVILAAAWSDPNFKRLGEEIAAFQQKGAKVVLVGPPIEFDIPLPSLLATEMRMRRLPSISAEVISQHENNTESAPLDQQMAKFAREEWKVQYVSYVKELCGRQLKSAWQTTDNCPLLLPSGEPLIFDLLHFTKPGSELFASQMKRDGLLP